MRSEGDAILDALQEAFEVGASSQRAGDCVSPEVRGIANWGRSGEVLAYVDAGPRGSEGWMRLLSLCRIVEHAGPAASGRAGKDHDHVEHAA
jgi:hypothetical protein